MNATSLKIAVLVSAGRNPLSGTARACPGDAIALAFAKTLTRSSVAVFHGGHSNDPALADYFAYGAGKLSVVPLTREDDTASALTPHLKDFDIILTGLQSERGRASGLVPYRIAHALDRPIVASAVSAEVAQPQSGELLVTQFLPKGQRRVIAVTLPVVVTVHPSSRVALNYAYARVQEGLLETLERPTPQWASNAPHWQPDQHARRPEQLKAPNRLSGHERMLSYIETPARRGLVVSEGTSVDKAQILLNYLREHHLIDL